SGILVLPTAAFAQASSPPSPAPGPQNGTFSVSANTDQANGSVTYRVDNTQLTSQGGTASTSSHRSGSGGRSCVGMTPDQAGVQFVGTGMTITPLYQGQQLPFVGG